MRRQTHQLSRFEKFWLGLKIVSSGWRFDQNFATFFETTSKIFWELFWQYLTIIQIENKNKPVNMITSA